MPQARPSQSCTSHKHGHLGARSSMERQSSHDSKGWTGRAHPRARTTRHARRPENPLGSVGGTRPEGPCHRRYCAYTTDTWGYGSDGADRNQVKQDMEFCMRRGHEGRDKQIGAFLAQTGRSIMHPGHHTRTAMYHRTATTTLRTSQRSRVDNQRQQRGGPNSEHDDCKATNTTIRQPHCCRNPTTNRPHKNELQTPMTHQNRTRAHGP